MSTRACKECGGVMEDIIRFVAMGTISWCPRCGTVAAGSNPTRWMVPTLNKPGTQNKARSTQTPVPPEKSARVRNRETGAMSIFEGPHLIDDSEYEILTWFQTKPNPPTKTDVCEHDRRSLGEVPSSPSECKHPSLPPGATFPCHQQNCPWTERQRDNDWWDGREGAMPGAYRPLPPMPDEGAF